MNTLKLTCLDQTITFSIEVNTNSNTGKKYKTVKIESSEVNNYFKAVYPYFSASIYDVILQNVKDMAESKLLNISQGDAELIEYINGKLAFLESLVTDSTISKFLEYEISTY